MPGLVVFDVLLWQSFGSFASYSALSFDRMVNVVLHLNSDIEMFRAEDNIAYAFHPSC